MREPRYDKNMSYDLIKCLFEYGVYSAKEVMWYVENGNITKDEFHFITSYNYDGLKESLKQKNGEYL